jgi:hypothetical protein
MPMTDERFERAELYDLDSDPFELRERAVTDPERLSELMSLLRERAAEVAVDPLRPDSEASP